MTAVIRLRRDFFEEVHNDLARQHAHAWERIGFLYGKLVRAGAYHIVLPFEYAPVPDNQYIEDETVGALIDADAMFAAHDRASRTGLCCLHVHSHGGNGRTWFSRDDLDTLLGLGPSLQRLAPEAAHGGLVLSNDGGASLLWLPARSEPVRADVSIVGFPITLHRGGS